MLNSYQFVGTLLEYWTGFSLPFRYSGGEAASPASIRLWPQQVAATGGAGQGGSPPWNPPFALRAERQKEPGRLDTVIKFRVTSAERDEARKRAAPYTLSDFIRRFLLEKGSARYRPRKVVATVDTRLLSELNRIGNNLNQIARGINTANQQGAKVDVAIVATQLALISSELRRIQNDTLDKAGNDA